MKKLISVIIILASTSSFGRLGETETECDIRYNKTGQAHEPTYQDKHKPLKIGKIPLLTRTYEYEGWQIRIGFLNSVACCMEYSRGSGNLSDDEVNAILQANEGAANWKKVNTAEAIEKSARIKDASSYTGQRDFWIRRDGCLAYLPGLLFSKNTLRLEKSEAVSMGIAEMKKKEAAKQKPIPQF
ncbi:MAG: hypothetical protein KJ645_05905 [Planctomycetes bacterium]|nr:hypothetical protein [Planctomycetota bacterium]